MADISLHIQALTVTDALNSLKTSMDGLDSSEASRRQAEFGQNHIEEVSRDALWLRFVREFTHFFALILWVAAALAFIGDHFDPGQGMASLGVAIIGVILINGLFSFWQEYKAEQAVAALRDLLPQKVKVMRDGQMIELLATHLVPGDIVLLEEGDFVPADGRLVESFALRVNTATVTGESLPKARQADPAAEQSPLFAKNIVLAGTSVVAGRARMVVYATGMHSEFGRIAHLTQTAGTTVSPLQIEIARLSRLVAMLATSIGLTMFFIGQAMGLPVWGGLLFAIGIIVALVPEGLLPTVTLSLAMATQRMARRNALIRHLPAVEALGSTTVICCDKTGTLTENRMAVKRLWFASGWKSADQLLAASSLQPHERNLLVNAGLCHNLDELETLDEHGQRSWRGDSTEIALVATSRRVIGRLDESVFVDEIPFDAERKRMSVLYDTPDGRMLYCKGALETLLPVCTAIQLGDRVIALNNKIRRSLLKAQDEMAHGGLRVLAFAQRNMGNALPACESGLILSGLVGLEDPPRAEVPKAIECCAAAGIRVIMVTGDHRQTALAIAREIGLVKSSQALVITGSELRSMSPAQLQLALDAREVIFARVAAEQKMRIVEALQKKGEIVAVTGDGVNDAPALKTANIGIAMGLSGTDVAREAADLILLDDNFASIVSAIEEGRAVFENIRKFLTYILSSNIPELVPYLAYALFRIPLPLTIIQILAVDLGTDMLPALALGAEKPDPEIMTRPPRTRNERLLSWPLLARAYLFLGMLEAAAAMAVYFIVLETNGWQYGQLLATSDPLYLEATTACLATIVIMQVANVFLCRHPTRTAFGFGLLANRLILIGIALELVLILAIAYTPTGQWLFGTAPLAGYVWLWAIAFALLLVGFEELRKVCQKKLTG